MLPMGLLHSLSNLSSDEIQYDSLKSLDLNSNSIFNEQNDNVATKYVKNNNYNLFEFNYLSKFSINLQDYFLKNKNDLTNQKIHVILIFNGKTSKSERLEEIQNLFVDYKVLHEYDIIPGIYMKCNALELKLLEPILQYSKISKIFKENVQIIPDINQVQLSSLNPEYLDNWWITAIGANNLQQNGTGVNVSIIDTGISYHPDLVGRVVNQKNFASEGDITYTLDYGDYNGHGTHVAGIIGGDGTVSSGKYRGVATAVNLINAKAANSSGSLKDADIIKAIEWSVDNQADIISMSFGTTNPDPYDPVTLAISSAVKQGVICVVSAGNAGPGYYSGGSPASGIDAIAVGSINKDGNLSSYSSWGPTTTYLFYPDVCAPGNNIISTESIYSLISNEQRFIEEYVDYSGYYDYIPLSGTSMSCPMVSGALALLLQAYPSVNPQSAKIALKEGARKINSHSDLKFGEGIINISDSIIFLTSVFSARGNLNNVTKIYPDTLPVEPFEMINFPGDIQAFNVSILSGIKRNVSIEIPNQISDVKVSIDKDRIEFATRGVNFTLITFEILLNATPGRAIFTINLTDFDTGEKLDEISVSIVKKTPEYKVLYESFHGLNDWVPEYSFKQIDFYNSMKKLTMYNCSLDYYMDYWTPNYKSSVNASILTPEKLSQYDLIVLQNPILPYNPSEVNAISDYFKNGGSVLFLGTRYQDMCRENINTLFYSMGVGVGIKDYNIENTTHIGIGALLYTNSVENFTKDSAIFNGVSKLYWETGSTFEIDGSAISQAQLYNRTVVASSDKTSEGMGRFLAFGDLSWLLDENYEKSSYLNDHSKLLQNSLNFLLPTSEISTNIGMDSFQVLKNTTGMSIFVKNQTTDVGVSDLINGTTLNATMLNPVTKEITNITFLNLGKGVYYNHSVILKNASYLPYQFNFSIKVAEYVVHKKVKIIRAIKEAIPEFEKNSLAHASITRASGQYNTFNTTLSKSDCNLTAYMGINPSSFYNSGKTTNKTIRFTEVGGKSYISSYYSSVDDPSGYAFYYFLAKSQSNYTNPYSDRLYFRINNNEPSININKSNLGNSIFFKDTQENNSLLIQNLFILTNYQFNIFTNESVNYEDNSSAFRVFVSLFMITVSLDGIISLMYPADFVYIELKYDNNSKSFTGSFLIPEYINYTSNGLEIQKTVYTSPYDQSYFGLFYITAWDSEGGSDDFFIVMQIGDSRIDPSIIIAIIVIIGVIGGILILLFILSKKNRYYSGNYGGFKEQIYSNDDFLDNEIEEGGISHRYCPFCGQKIKINALSCKYCGRDILV